jgi:Trk K+ transport system NAD-binding subunit
MVFYIDRKGNTTHIEPQEQDTLRIVGDFKEETELLVSFYLANGLTIRERVMTFEDFDNQASWVYKIEESEKVAGISKFQFRANQDGVVVATGRGLIRR